MTARTSLLGQGHVRGIPTDASADTIANTGKSAVSRSISTKSRSTTLPPLSAAQRADRAQLIAQPNPVRTNLRGEASADVPVFLSRKGGALDPNAVHRIVLAAAARAGRSVEISAHWLRYAHASHSLDRGAPIYLVQATLGHAPVATMERYLQRSSFRRPSLICCCTSALRWIAELENAIAAVEAVACEEADRARQAKS